MDFMEKNHRNPSRHRLEEHDLLNWIKANRKKMNAEELKAERLSLFKKLLASMEVCKRKNQYEWKALLRACPADVPVPEAVDVKR